VRPILLHGAEIWGAIRQIGLTTFGSQERDPTEQVHRSFFRSLLGVRASTSGVSILGEFGRFPLFVDRARAISLYYNRLLRLRDSGRLVSLAFEDSVRLAEEVEFMLHSTALPESCSPPTLVRGWFGDAMAILGRAYRRPCIRSFPECDTSSISSYMQHQYLTGPHRQGSMMATYDSIWDGESYGCAPYIRRQYFIEAHRTLARFRTGSHDLAALLVNGCVAPPPPHMNIGYAQSVGYIV
jgi:hypothetical protein